MLQVRLLGQFEVRRDGTPLFIHSRAAQSLLAFLVLNAGIPHRREKLAGLLWPDFPEETARNNLRRELWRLRKLLPAEGYLQSGDSSVTFDTSAQYWLDTAILEHGGGEDTTTQDRVDALSVYRGELLPGFYDEWVVSERERLRALFEHKMARLLACLEQERRWQEVCEWGERWIAQGRSPEPAFRALMVAHAEAGDRSQVAAVYQRCVEALRTDLGVEPSEQTCQLFEQLTSARATRVPVTAPLSPSRSEQARDQPPAPGEPPFQGLAYFNEADADRFFGREQLTAQLVAHLREHSLLVVVGASGSGKSSLVRAGLIPALKRGTENSSSPESRTEWQVYLLTPTAHPLHALAVALTREVESITAAATLADDLERDPRSLAFALTRLIAREGAPPLLLVVDQFEELFTLCRDETEREAFVDNLMGAVQAGGSSQIKVVLTLRADFYAHCAQYPALREAVAKYQEYIGPMTAEEMQRAIDGPAERGGWTFEPGLVDLILRDMGDEPGALPLLSHALLETWYRRRGRTLTLKGYAASGGVRGAIAQTAKTVFHQLSPDWQAIAREIFLQLTELGEGTPDTRRRVPLKELTRATADATAVRGVLDILAGARLVTLGGDSVEVAHEALIREWPALRDWLNQDREELRLHRRLSESAQAWEKSNRDPSELYRGARLAQAIEWVKTRVHELMPLDQKFIDASKELQAKEETEREQQRLRELQVAQKLVEVERQHAERAEEERRTAFVRELSVNAVNNLDIDPERSILLALQAVSISSAGSQTVLREAEEALHRAVMTSRVQLTLRGHTALLNKIAYSPDGKHLATASNDGTARVWDATTGQLLLTLAGHAGPVSDVVFSPDGKRLATSSDDGTAKVWDAATGQELLVLRGHADQVRIVAFSPDGKRLVTGGGRMMVAPSVDHTAKVWDAATGQLLFTYSGQMGNIRGITFSPDGARIASASDDGTVQVWDATTGQGLLTFAAHTDVVYEVVFSPDGKRLATTSKDRTIKMWDATRGDLLLTLFGHTSNVWAVAFNQAGTRLYTASLDGTAKMWDAATGQVLLTLAGHTAGLRDLTLSPDGTRVATAGDNTARVWDVTPVGAQEWTTLAGHTSEILTAVFSPDGKHIATGSADKTAKVWDAATGKELLTLKSDSDQLRSIAYSPDGKCLVAPSLDQTAKVWDATTGQMLLTLPTKAPPFVFGLGVAYSPDGTRIATASENNTAKVWDATTGDELITLTGHTDVVVRVAFSPDGKSIATGDMDGSAKIWNAQTGKELLMLKGHIGFVDAVTFSPDGTHLATGNNDGTAKVWDAATGKELFTLTGHSGQINAVAFSPDGTQLATGSTDGTVKVWNIAGGGGPSRQPLTLYPGGTVWSVAYSPDGRRLVTGGTTDGVARVWALPLEDIVAIAKSRVTRALTTDECQKYLHVGKCP